MNKKIKKFREYIWMNGELIKNEDAKVHVMSHALHYGSGFFEGIRAYKNKDEQVVIFRLDDHVQRLINSARVYYIDIPYSFSEIKQAIIQVVKANDFQECYIRPFVFVGEGFKAIEIDQDLTINLAISAWELKYYNTEQIKLSVSSYRRYSNNQCPMQSKAIGNYMNSFLIRREAKNQGSNDGISLDMKGNVSETSTANIFLVKNKKIITPDNSSSILNGITRLTVIELLEDMGYQVIERTVGRDELYYADEVFITGTASEVKVCSSIDQLKVGNGNYPIANIIKEQYIKVTTGQLEKYNHWLTDVK